MEHTLNLKYNLDEAAVKRQLTELVNRTASNHLTGLFSDGRYGGDKGVAHMVITEQIDKLICDDRTVNLIQRLIEENWERILTEATLKALEHKAHRMAFGKAKEPLNIKHGD